jgi:hypothetical protein
MLFMEFVNQLSFLFEFFLADYADCLMNTTFSIAKVSHMNDEGIQLYIEVPPPLCSEYDRPVLRLHVLSKKCPITDYIRLQEKM